MKSNSEEEVTKLSIIVPIYKSEAYLARCIESILKQEFKDYEIILVDDGSPDACPFLCDEYSTKYSFIKTIHKLNAGVSAARNTGIENAGGEYITFIDSDDYIEKDMYASMMEVADLYSCDFVMCDCIKEYATHSELYSHDIREGYYDLENLKKEYYPHLLMMENVEYPPTISNWLCVFRRELVNGKEKIRYVEGVRFSEDLLFGAEVMTKAKSFYYMKGKGFYHYVMNPSSASHVFTEDKWNDYLKLFHCAETYFSKMTYNFSSQLDKMLLFLVYNAVGNVMQTPQITKKEKYKRVVDILNTDSVKTMFRRIHVYELPISSKLKIITIIYKYRIGLRLWINRKS